ncbi:hypothetical protein FOS14_20270 [Skermania sp. ID1734]|uniref:hypothetical protein n=1 Tax=Skermania sp. ID1734 TaxID=2597516 RepID=UPI00117E3523|nr:hypothetical protein [Skermania sp. ID1734]TSD94645.1 hypothetical protein FOS14_20270 [Skermania sp. ID1734]
MSENNPPTGGEGPDHPQGQGVPPNQPPGYGTPPPGYGQHPPGYGQQPPQYGQQPPGYGQQPPSYGEQTPQYGQQPPQYGQEPYTQQPPGYGQQPPQYGQTGTPNYGAPPSYGEPFPGGAYGPGGFGTPQLSVGAALSYGWEKFKSNAGVWVGITLIGVIISALVRWPFGGYGFSYSTDDNGFPVGSFVLSIVGLVVGFVVSTLIQAAFVRGALHEVDGNRPAFGSFFQFSNVAQVLVASLLIGIASSIGFVLCIIPGIVVLFLTWYTLQFVLDQNQDAVTAIKSSFRIISENAGTLVLLGLACIALNILGAILLLVGLLVTGPITLIASTYAYRVLVNGPVSPATS